jgi:hypothetical protein
MTSQWGGDLARHSGGCVSSERDETGEPDIKLAGLSLWARSREFPGSDDDWDGNWIDLVVFVDAPGARVERRGPYLRSDDLAAFREQLAALHSDLKGTANLDCIEPALKGKVGCGSLGHIEVAVDITPDHLRQSHQFVFDIDQSYLATTLAGCARVLDRFPAKSSAAEI